MTTLGSQSSTKGAREAKPARAPIAWASLARHYVEMLISMVIGMMALHPVWHFGLEVVGASHALNHATVMALVMATDMSLGMGAWMRYRGHSWGPIAEMSAVMYLPFALFLPAVWGGALSGAAMLGAGHLLMLPTMLGLMLWRRDEYGHGSSSRTPQPIGDARTPTAQPSCDEPARLPYVGSGVRMHRDSDESHAHR